jgi:hypothetical protein
LFDKPLDEGDQFLVGLRLDILEVVLLRSHQSGPLGGDDFRSARQGSIRSGSGSNGRFG